MSHASRIPRPLRVVAGALVALAASATLAVASGAAAPASASAASAAWPARTVATGGPAFHRAVDGLPGGAVATLLEVHQGRASRLELWVGTRHTRIATSADGHFFDAELGHDGDGRVVVAYTTVPDGAGARQAYAWTAAHGTQPLTSGPRSVTTADVAVAPDGRAAIAASVGATRVVVSRGTVEDGFGDLQTLAEEGGFPAPVGIARDGTVTVAWHGRNAVGLARAAWGQPFGEAFTVPVPHLDELAFADTADGRAVVAAKQTARVDGAYQRDVVTFAWEPGAPRPGSQAVVSQGQAGVPAAVAVGERAFVVWRQARTSSSGPATLGVAVFGPDGGAPRVRLTVPGRGGAGGPLGSIALAPSGTGVRPYFGVGGSVHTTHVDARGRVSGTSVALAPSEGRPALAVADAGGPVAVWTRPLFDGNAGYRVRIARP